MKPLPPPYQTFVKCKPFLRMIGGMIHCIAAGHKHRSTTTHTEARRERPPGGREHLLVEHADVRVLGGEAGVAAIPPSESAAEQILQK